jgi:hypothetical protein
MASRFGGFSGEVVRMVGAMADGLAGGGPRAWRRG